METDDKHDELFFLRDPNEKSAVITVQRSPLEFKDTSTGQVKLFVVNDAMGLILWLSILHYVNYS